MGVLSCWVIAQVSVTSSQTPCLQVWRTFCNAHGTLVSLCCRYHPQSNGQTERVNEGWESTFRCVAANHPASWSSFLPWVGYAHNSLVSAATGLLPFTASLGYQPPLSTSRRTRWYALRSGQSVSLQELMEAGLLCCPTFIPTFPETVQSLLSLDFFLSSRPEGVDLPLQVELIPASCLHLQVQLKLNNTNDTLIDNGTYTRHHSFLVRVRMHVLHVSAVGFHHFPYTFERRAASETCSTNRYHEWDSYWPSGEILTSNLKSVINYFNNLRKIILDVNTAKALWVGVSTFYLRVLKMWTHLRMRTTIGWAWTSGPQTAKDVKEIRLFFCLLRHNKLKKQLLADIFKWNY